MRKPWYRKDRKTWFLETDSGRINLGKNKKKAFELWHQIEKASQQKDQQDPLFTDLYLNYFAFASKQVSDGQFEKRTLKNYCIYLDLFADQFGDLPVSEILPYHITDWISSFDSWGPSSQRAAIKAVKRLINWGVQEGRVSVNQIAGVRKPKGKSRDVMVSIEDHKRMIDESRKIGTRVGRRFVLVLVALRHCGGRPQDISNVKVEYVDREFTKWVLPEHKRKRSTGQPKVVYLSPCLSTVTKILSSGRKSGPLFQSRKGGLTVIAIGHRMTELKKTLNLHPQLVAYSYRHTYITDSITKGIDIATIAELTGTSVQMIQQHYGHLLQKHDHLRSAAARAMRPND